MNVALLAALAEGAGGEAGRRAVEDLAGAVAQGAGASAQALAEAACHPARQDAVRAWGDKVAELLAADRTVARAVVAAMERHTPGSGTWYCGDHTDFRGGLFLREVIGLQINVQVTGAAAPEAMASLPPRPGGFTGRDDETAALLRALDPAVPRSTGSPEPTAVLVAAVSGLGGIGKTALAVQSAHLACEKGWFPGGTLFVDLHGYDEDPVTADQALQSLLRALGVPPEHIPATVDDRVALYRSVLAERARKDGAVLVLADNASSPDQVRPLLPGDARHRVLVTSRDRLPQLGARLVPLDQLTPKAAYELLDLALRIADPDDSRVTDDAEAAERLAALCGHLPLALQIAAALLAEDPEKPVTELVDELAVSHDRLAHLDDGDRSVRAAFDLSYRRLSPSQARLLRLLALAPGPEASDEVVAALIGADAPPARDLKALARAHLVERGSGRGRWRLHDLVRAYGAGVVAGDVRLRGEGEAARGRVLEFYHRWADAADDRLRWLPGMPEPERFGDRGRALAWLDGERAGLVAAVQWAREERYADVAVRLSARLAVYLDWRRYFDDLITISRVAQQATHRAGNRLGEAGAWSHLGSALREVGRVGEAIEVHTRARDLYQAVEDRRLEAIAWNNLGGALQLAGRVGEAIEAHTRARDLYQAAEDRHSEASAWNNLGLVLREVGRVGEAVEAHTRACVLYQAAEDRHREAVAWINLGNALYEVGWTGEAIEAFGKARETLEDFEDWYNAGRALVNLALAHEDTRRPAEARAHWLRAADAFTRADAPDRATEARARAAELNDPPPGTPTPT
ncbi:MULTISPECIES: tetratricopeptide repeat protein [unclassified Streptomyces]|uniref:tetratricopeptide repeat protein n=1 Tax=unclassified Streptomyces TaxID=2593676 RepID=UPI002E820C94|nr:tetratricopeptide repeat protein [Streptomyces sp. NBC_00589]WTI36174.1 tetratricopeptide repeat protein [Streptomyces sp. NBC_00775]WUB30151.1 tetratricopeptide repeat protein [Streptomyces sp. NBC_00589]